MENTHQIQKRPIPKTQLMEGITLAVSTQWHALPDRFEWIAANGFAMAYALNAMKPHLTKEHITSSMNNGIPVRYHGYFPGFEIGAADKQKAEEALTLHKKAIDAIMGMGEQVMTVHIGLVPHIELNYEYIVRNLCQLVEYADKKGVKICLENLRTGLTSNPETVVELSEKCGALITLDVGHAVSCERVATGDITVIQIIEMFRHVLEEVHFYEYETDTHYAPVDMSILGPVVDALFATGCKWWTIELTSYDDILNTRRLVKEYLMEKMSSIAA